MNQATEAHPRSLLIHDGELADVRALLVSLGIPFVERFGAESPADRANPWDLVIASAKRILELKLPTSAHPPKQIAILAHDARTLRSSLRRSGTTLIVRRPVHPAALRALVVHSLYRGPEKRRSARVNVGAPVRVKLGWRNREALLVNLSVTGCRLMTNRPVERGRSFRLQIPSEVAGGRAVAVEARVVECLSSPDPALGRFITSASFARVDARLHAQLTAAVAAHAEGPAVCAGAPPIAAGAAGPPAGPGAESASTNGAPPDPLDQEAAHVLMGRDLSRGGMRIDPNPLLAVGMNLRLAVHAETREAPMILSAMVVRDDGERGLLLRFRDLSAELARYLDYVIHALPLVIDDDDDEGCLIAELVEAS
jgi:PilZ domain-containing protein